LPGPKKDIVRHLGKEYQSESNYARKLAEEKNKLKNHHLLGSYYQDGKYLSNYKPSRAYKTYVKSVKNEWDRNPNNEVALKAR